MAHVVVVVHVLGELLQDPRSVLLTMMLVVPLLICMIISGGRQEGDASKLLSLLPTPPRNLPIIGHLHLMGDLPYVSLAGLATKYGPDLMLVHLGASPTVVVSSPRAAEAVLRTHDHIFASRPRSRVWDVIMYGQTDSCFAPYGDYFRRARKLVTVHLLNASKVRAQRPAREEEVRGVMGKIGKAAAAGEAVDMSELLHALVNDLICRAVSGKAEGLSKLFRELTDVNAALLGGFNILDFLPSLGRMELVRRVACAKALRVRKRWDKLLDKLIDDHAARRIGSCHEDDDDAEEDFIHVSLCLQKDYGLSRDNIKAILIDMFEAGTDTSYMTLEFAMAELIRKPHLMSKLQEEVRRNVPKGQEMVSEDDLPNMTYLCHQGDAQAPPTRTSHDPTLLPICLHSS